jgi:hypothetical protein
MKPYRTLEQRRAAEKDIPAWKQLSMPGWVSGERLVEMDDYFKRTVNAMNKRRK